MERFRFRRVVARSFWIWARDLPLLLALVLVVHVPRVALGEALARAWPMPEALEGTGPAGDRFERWYARALPSIVSRGLVDTLFAGLAVALVIFAVCARLQGRRAGFGACLRGGLARVLPVVYVSACLFAATAAFWHGSGFVLWRLHRREIASLGAMFLWLAWVGGPLLQLLLSPFWVATPAAVVEEPRRLLRRSWQLTRGHRIAVLAILILIYGIGYGLRLAVPEDLSWLATKAIGWAQDLLVLSLAAVFAAVGYHALRLEKDGVDVSRLEQVFA